MPAGPTGRHARLHQRLFRYNITVARIPGMKNAAADALSRWAYPASREGNDVSWHGTAKDREKMKAIIAAEKEEEKTCILTKDAVPTEALLVRMEPRRAARAVMGIIKDSQQLSVAGTPVEVRTLRLEMDGPEEPSEMVAVATCSGRRTEEATEQPTAWEATPAPLPAAVPSAAPAVDEWGNQVERAPHPPATFPRRAPRVVTEDRGAGPTGQR